MFLKSIEIQNFRSISNLNVEDLGQINIFTGENNCGKTTVLESIFQLLAWQVGNLPLLNTFRAFNTRTAIDLTYFFHYSNTNNPIKLSGIFENDYTRSVQIQYSETNSNWNGAYSFIESTLSEEKKTVSNELKHRVNLTNSSEEPIHGKELFIPNCSFPSFKVLEHGNLIGSLSEMIKNKERQKVVDLLKPLYSQIQDIEVIEKNIFLNLRDFAKLLPIELSGDGLRRILSLILAIYGVKGGIVLIDEIENGLHFSTMPKFWRGLINAAKEMEVQLFITTHNEELLHSLKQVASEDAYEPMQEKIRYYNLKRYQNDEIIAYKYDFEKFGYLIENGNVIR